MTTLTRPRPHTSAMYLSLPTPVEVVNRDENGCAWLREPGQWVRIASMKNLWEIDGYCQPEQPVLRMHFLAVTESGDTVLLYQDLVEGRWFRQLTLGDELGGSGTPAQHP